MNATHRQLKSAARGTVNSSSGWDGKSLVEIYNELRSQYSHRIALEMTERIKQNRIWAVTMDEGLHLSKDQAFAWLMDCRFNPYVAARMVWGQRIPKDVYQAIEAVASKLNAEHRQALEDARVAG